MSVAQTNYPIPDAVAEASPAKPHGGDETRILVSTAIVIAIAAFVLLGFLLWKPSGFVLDEATYVPVARALLHGKVPRFAPVLPGWQHPPLGSYLIAVGLVLAGDNAVGWRIVPAIFGALTLVAIFFWSYLLTRDYRSAVSVTALTALNHFWFVMSRLAMLDVFVVTFSIWGTLGMTAALTPQFGVRFRRACVLFSGVMFGFGLACKWIALDTMFVMFAIAFGLMVIPAQATKAETELARLSRGIREVGWPTLLVGALALPVLCYVLPVCVELWQSTGSLSFREVLVMHARMYQASKSFPGSLAMRAPWYTWPLRTTPFRGLSYLLGNFVVMWFGLAGIAVCFWRLCRGFRLPESMVLLLYVVNVLQWVITPIRTPLYYYYLPATMMLAPAAVLAFGNRRVGKIRVSFMLILGAFAMFLYCYPRMTYLEAPWDCIFGCWN